MKKLLSLTIFLVLCPWLRAQIILAPQIQSVTVVSSPQPGMYDLYELELNIAALPYPNGGNPEYYYYDPDIIDLYVTFIAPSGKEFRIDGFYYKEYEHECLTVAKNDLINWTIGGQAGINVNFDANSLTQDDVDKAPITHYEHMTGSDNPPGRWRVRFAPNEPGVWKYMVTLEADLNTGWGTTQFNPGKNVVAQYPTQTEPPSYADFTCDMATGGVYKGYLQPNHTGRRIAFENGENFYPMGPIIQTSFDVDLHNPRMLGNTSLEGGVCYFNECIDRLSENRANYFRICINSLYTSAQNTGYINYRDNQYSGDVGYYLKNAWRYDLILEHAREKNVYIKFAGLAGYSTDIEGWGTPGNPWYDGDPQHKFHWCFFDPSMSAAIQKRYKHSIRYIIARWGYSQNVFAWEFYDEADHDVLGIMNDPGHFADYINWMQDISGFTKEKDYNRHMITNAGFANTFFETDPACATVCMIDNIDLLESNGAKEGAFVDKSNMCNWLSGFGGWNSDESIFKHPDDVFAVIPKPYFHNSYWLTVSHTCTDMHNYHNNEDTSTLNEYLKDRLGLDVHNIFWHSLFSNSYGLISPFFGNDVIMNTFTIETFGHCMDVRKRWYTKGQAPQYKPIAQYLDVVGMLSEEMVKFSSYDNQVLFFRRDASNPAQINPEPDLFRSVGLLSPSGRKMYGWVQLSAGEYQAARGAYCEYVTELNNKPAVTMNPANIFIEFPVSHVGKYRITWYNTATYIPASGGNDPYISHDLVQYHFPNDEINDINLVDLQPYEKTSAGGKVRFSIPNLDGAYGDMAYIVEYITPSDENPLPYACAPNRSDFTRMVDVDNDGVDDIVFNNRCFKDNMAFRAFQVGDNTATPMQATVMSNYDIPHNETRFNKWMDDGDLWVVGDFTSSHPGSEYLLVNKNFASGGPGLFMLVDPANGNIMKSVPARLNYMPFMDATDRFMVGNVDKDRNEEMIAINTDRFQNIAAIGVYDMWEKKVKKAYNHHPGLHGWFDAGDNALLCDVEGDGKKELVLINNDAASGPGFFTALDLTQPGLFPVGSPFVQYSFNPAFEFFNEPCDRVVVGNVFINPLHTAGGSKPDKSEELIFINTSGSTSEPALMIVDASTGIILSIVQNSSCNFCGWYDVGRDRSLLMDVDGNGISELVFFDANASFSNGGIMAISLAVPNTFSIINMSLGSPSFSTTLWTGNEDNVMVGRNISAPPARDFLVLVNRDNAPPVFVTRVLDLSTPVATNVALTTQFSNDFKGYMDGVYAYNCDGSTINMGTQANGQGGSPLNKKSTSVEETKSRKATCIPNPAASTIKVQVETPGEFSYAIYDMTGRELLKGNSNGEEIDVSALIHGLYLVKVTDSEKYVSTFKLVKE